MKLQASFALLSLFLPVGQAFLVQSGRHRPSLLTTTSSRRGLQASNLPTILLKEEGEEQEDEGQTAQKLLPLPIAQWQDEVAEGQRRPLTMGARMRLEKEIVLLEQLRHSDKPLQALLALWVQARGNDAAKDVVMAQDFLRLPSQNAWRKAESMLVNVIHQEGVAQWTEPVCLLAKLREWQGQFQESRQLYELVLQQKPWHVGALLGVNAVCTATDTVNDEVAHQWKEAQMPPVRDVDARNAWVDRMVSLVQAQLNESHQRRSEWERSSTSSLNTHNDEAWQ
jgi:hypothetical protein